MRLRLGRSWSAAAVAEQSLAPTVADLCGEGLLALHNRQPGYGKPGSKCDRWPHIALTSPVPHLTNKLSSNTNTNSRLQQQQFETNSQTNELYLR